MQCARCQRENRDDARFCDGCGAGLAALCAACGRELRPEARFCDGCGQATPAAAEPPAAAAAAPDLSNPRSYTPRHLAERILTQKGSLEGERKHVTVLFADVAGYTALAEHADPEDMHGLMDRCFQLILDRVHHYEGTVNQFTGDGVMALFGAPLALEDAPRRAVLAALAIQRALEPLHQEVQGRFGAGFQMRIGIHSGPVVVGRIGDDLRMDYTAVGDTTNLAARLQQAAQPGALLISAATQNLVKGFFELRDVGALQLKGKSQPVRAYEVRAERPVSGRVEAAVASGLTALAGRDAELEALHTAFEAASEGRGQVVMLVGEPGIGKSRLLYEFRQQLADRPHTWFEGRCSPFGSASAFEALVDGYRRRVGLEDRDDEATALAKLAAFEAEHGGGLEWTLPHLRTLLSLPPGDAEVAGLDPMSRRSETVRALQARFLRSAEQAPLVVAIEDLHWIDAASEEFLGFLAESVPTARLLLLLTYRPGYVQPFGDRSYHVRIALQPLSADEMAAMAGSVLEASALPEELRQLITSKAEGNPFFVEEVTKSLLEDGALRMAGDRVELLRDVADISVPDSIQDVLMARLDRLEEEPKRAIQVASVIGREFALRLLTQVREAGDHVQDVIGELRSLELIYEKAAHPELAFMFKHALTHDVAYESILISKRRALHRIVGAAIEELYRERLSEQYDAMAHHFERGEDWPRALQYHELAAGKAAEAFANRALVQHAQAALRIADRLGDELAPERRVALEEQLGVAFFALSDFRRAGRAYERAAQACPKEALRARNLGRAAFSHIWGHDYEATRRTAAEAHVLAQRCGEPAAEVIATTADDLLAVTIDGPRGRSDVGVAALELAERCGDSEAQVYALTQRALYVESGGDYHASIELSERASRLAAERNWSLLTIYPQWTLGLSLGCLGDYPRALSVLQRALELCDRCGDRALKARLLNTVGWCYAEFGCHHKAQLFNRAGEELGAEMVRLELVEGAPELHANAAINLANNHTALGDPEAARGHLMPILEGLDVPGDPWQRWRYALHVQDGLARAALAQGDPERALGHLAIELEQAKRHSVSKVIARAHELRGRALLVMDDRDAAGAALRKAHQVAEAIGYPPVLWRTLSLQAELARRAGEGGEAERLAHAARSRTEALAKPLPDELGGQLRALGRALAEDPLGAYR